MNGKKRYISCLDKHVIISFAICLIVGLLTNILINNASLIQIAPNILHVLFWIIVIFLSCASWISAVVLLTIINIGLIIKYFPSKQSTENNTKS